MGQNLVTIATFDQAAKARLVQNALKEAGIRAVVTDEAIVSMDWLLSNAVGGVKVQVLEEDAERAVNMLEGEFGEDGSGLGPLATNEQELASEAEAAEPEDAEEQQHALSIEKETPESASVDPESREEYARRFVFAAALGLMFPPIAFYALYLFMNAVAGGGTLSPRGRFNVLVGGLMMLPWICLMGFFLLLRYW